jgi:hypothetical protein
MCREGGVGCGGRGGGGARHVVLLALRLGEVARLAEDLEQRDRAEDLHLAQRRERVPLLAGEARLVRVRVRVR